MNSLFENKTSVEPVIPRVSERELVRYFSCLARKVYNLDEHFYPLGSCTMKHNPKINERVAALEPFLNAHPHAPEEFVQGSLRVMAEMEAFLCEITGMDAYSLQPAAGAHGELTGLLMVKACHAAKGGRDRTTVIVPDTSHGTNPASAAMLGYSVVTVRSTDEGDIDIEHLKTLADDTTAAIMITIPNTLGLYERRITEITDIVHKAGGLCYCDGANMNALLGIVRPRELGFDVMHVNLHKTFSAPHGGGGPGSGPVGVTSALEPYLPNPRISKTPDGYRLSECPESVGKMRSFYGNFGVVLRAFTYISMLGAEGLKKVAEGAIINANYCRKKLEAVYELPYKRTCMHEFVLSAGDLAKSGVHAMDIAKKLLDYTIHPPTMYFPLIVEEALMIEPTETEKQETLDRFIDAMIEIYEMSSMDPGSITSAPQNTPVKRVDEVMAARKPVITYDS